MDESQITTPITIEHSTQISGLGVPPPTISIKQPKNTPTSIPSDFVYDTPTPQSMTNINNKMRSNNNNDDITSDAITSLPAKRRRTTPKVATPITKSISSVIGPWSTGTHVSGTTPTSSHVLSTGTHVQDTATKLVDISGHTSPHKLVNYEISSSPNFAKRHTRTPKSPRKSRDISAENEYVDITMKNKL